MKKAFSILLLPFFLFCSCLHAQKMELNRQTLDTSKVFISFEKVKGKKAVRVVKDTAVKDIDEPTFALIKNSNFKNGTIKVKVLSRLLSTASPNDRGFIGVAFRINDTKTLFECIYIRPTNGRAADQVRRNHAVQYFSYPGYKFNRLRKESPEMYESYADMGLNEWITMKIIVKNKQARLFLNGSKQPCLIVNDLKQGDGITGAVALFVDVGTEGFFRDVEIQKEL
jgi:Domain of Unknown Function (DUF1080)